MSFGTRQIAEMMGMGLPPEAISYASGQFNDLGVGEPGAGMNAVSMGAGADVGSPNTGFNVAEVMQQASSLGG